MELTLKYYPKIIGQNPSVLGIVGVILTVKTSTLYAQIEHLICSNRAPCMLKMSYNNKYIINIIIK